jgi:predicted trehalose synthase
LLELVVVGALHDLDRNSLVAFLSRQRWFGGKARTIADVWIDDEGATPGIDATLCVLAVRFADGKEERYFVPPIEDDEACRALLDVLLRGRTLPLSHGRIASSVGEAGPQDPPYLPVRRTAPDQSNTSILFGDELIMKVFRRVEPGLNPDVEIGRFLTAHGFTRVPALVADAEYFGASHVPGTCLAPGSSVLMLQQFVPNEGNAWHAMLAGMDRSSTLALAETLGRRTGELHDTLASDTSDPAFTPEPYSRADLAALADRMRAFGDRQLALLRETTGTDPKSGSVTEQLARQVLDRADALLARFDALRDVQDAGSRIRCHGDYHLGQTLVTDGDVYILDFEGEPARPLAERRAKSSPLRDVAGMLRSFSYAAQAGEKDAGWEPAVIESFRRGYRAATDGAAFLPPEGEAFETVLDAFLLEKALYEVGYELNNRPDWVELPLSALARVQTRV